jgi:hypothetical protein
MEWGAVMSGTPAQGEPPDGGPQTCKHGKYIGPGSDRTTVERLALSPEYRSAAAGAGFRSRTRVHWIGRPGRR